MESKTIKYPQAFIDSVKAEFPDNPSDIFEHLENNSRFVGRFLDDNKSWGATP